MATVYLARDLKHKRNVALRSSCGMGPLRMYSDGRNIPLDGRVGKGPPFCESAGVATLDRSPTCAGSCERRAVHRG